MVKRMVLSFFAAMCVLTAGSMVKDARAAGPVFQVCHKPGNGGGQTISVGSPSAVAAHVAHGDYVGTCAVPNTCRQTCNDAFADCYAAAAGDPDVLAACVDQLSACLASCP